MLNIEGHRKAQDFARDVMNHLMNTVKVGNTEYEIAAKIQKYFGARKVGFWYHVPALVFVGNQRSLVSESGSKYSPNQNARLGTYDLFTVDLSPMIDGCWGDYARTFVTGSKKVMKSWNTVKNVKPYNEPLRVLRALHKKFRASCKPSWTFSDVYGFANGFLEEKGCVNLDFLGNVGHSIESRMQDRRYIVRGDRTRVDEVLFTLEPHIAVRTREFGVKHENIYYFQNGRIHEL